MGHPKEAEPIVHLSFSENVSLKAIFPQFFLQVASI